MRHKATRELYDYWNGLRGDRLAPERGDIDPAAIRGVLADTFMLDVDLERGFPFRLAGTRVNALLDAEQKGRHFLDLWRFEERRNAAAIVMTVTDAARPVLAGVTAAPRGQEECVLEMLLLPLRHFGRTHARILGLIKPTHEVPWLGLLPIGPLSLRSLRIVENNEILDDASGRVAVNQTPPAAIPAVGSVLVAEARTRPTRPQLRVIEGGR